MLTVRDATLDKVLQVAGHRADGDKARGMRGIGGCCPRATPIAP
jgi:hypothetical protein